MMKKLLVLCICLEMSYADLSVKQIEQMIEKIHLKREGVDLATLEKTKEPFMIMKKEDNRTVVKTVTNNETIKLSLHALMGGKAYINEGWKKVGEKIMGYTVEYIGKRGVVLRNGNTIRTLFLKNKKDNQLIMLEERE